MGGLRIGWVGMFALLTWGTTCAQPQVPQPDAPTLVVIVGMHVNKVQEINFKDGRVTLDFHIWFKWREPGQKPVVRCKEDAGEPQAACDKTAFNPLKSMELMNGKIDARSSKVEKVLQDNIHYASERWVVTVYKVWDISRFPFDRHTIELQLEDSERDRKALSMVPSGGSRLGKEIQIAGWRVPTFTHEQSTQAYDTDFGEGLGLRNAASQYSRATFRLDVVRNGPGPAVRLLTIVCLATLVAFVPFAINPRDIDPRFGLGVGAMFAVVANAFTIAQAVPDSDVLTVADKMHILCMAFIFSSIVVSALCLRWAETGREALQQRVDKWCTVGFPLAYTLTTAALIYWAV